MGWSSVYRTVAAHPGEPARRYDVMQIMVLYVEDCPNHALARRNLDAALARAALGDVVVDEQRVDTDEDARRLGMCGSPTIFIDGQDPFAAPDNAPSLSCRLYRSGGAVSGSPSVDDLAAALQS